MEKFTCDFDQSSAAYLPGQSVNGSVYLKLTEPESFKGLTAECVGKSQVHWSESETSGRETETIHYQSSENYFYNKIVLFAGNEEEMEPGEYHYRFSFVLPQQLPTSFEGVHGSLRYYVKVQLNRRFMLDAVFKRGFTVNNIVDLNRIPEAALPLRNEASKVLCCLCCQSGPITASCWLNKTGFVPGEPIIFCATKTVYRAQGKQKENERIIGVISRCHPSTRRTSQGTLAHNQSPPDSDILDVWDHVPIVIPPLAPSDLHLCSIIDLSYVLEFIVNPGTMSFNFKVPLEIIIGTVPLRQSFSSFQPSAPPKEDPTSNNVIFKPFINQYPNLPMPTYDSSLFSGNLREEGDTEHLNIGFDTLFRPRYVRYTSREDASSDEK